MAQTVIVVVGQPRSVTNGIAGFLARLGASLAQQFPPTPNSFNQVWADDGQTQNWVNLVLGLDPNLQLPGPTRPNNIPQAYLTGLYNELQQRAALAAPLPVIFLLPTACLVDLQTALPGSNFIIVNAVRATATRIASLVNAYAGMSTSGLIPPPVPTTAQIAAFVAASDTNRTAVLAATNQGVPVVTINISDIIANATTALTALAVGVSLDVPTAADIAFINVSQISNDAL